MEKYLNKLKELVNKAEEEGEVPIAAIVVEKETIIGEGYNRKERFKDPLLHAEILAIKEACLVKGDWRLDNCEIYVSLEPCPMCRGAIKEARIKKIHYFATREKEHKKIQCEKVGGKKETAFFEKKITKFFKAKR